MRLKFDVLAALEKRPNLSVRRRRIFTRRLFMLELLRIDDAVEQLIIILDGDELPLRDVTEVRTLIEIYSQRKTVGQQSSIPFRSSPATNIDRAQSVVRRCICSRTLCRCG